VVYSNASIVYSLESYIDFHKILLPYKTQIFITNFSEVISGMGTVIGKLNERFNLNLSELPNSDQFIQRVNETIQKLPWSTDPKKISLPDPRRNALIEAVREQMQSPRYKTLMKEAEELYSTIAG